MVVSVLEELGIVIDPYIFDLLRSDLVASINSLNSLLAWAREELQSIDYKK